MRVLVTGAAGRIGNVVARHLRGLGATVTGLVLEGQQADAEGAVDRLVVGDATSAGVAERAVRGQDVIVHLAAIPSPHHDPGPVVFGTNAVASYAILDAAGDAGARFAVLASSLSILGLRWSRGAVPPLELPLGIRHPALGDDPYGLSKRVDELTAEAMTARHGMPVLALRLPFVGGADRRLPEWTAGLEADPASGALDLWAYLETRDVARAVAAAAERMPEGFTRVYAAAPTIAVAGETAELVARHLPTARLTRPLVGGEVPIDLDPVRELIGFEAEHVLRPPSPR